MARPLYTAPVSNEPATSPTAFKRRIATGPQLYTNSLPGKPKDPTSRYEPVTQTPFRQKILITGVIVSVFVGGLVIAGLSKGEKTPPLTPSSVEKFLGSESEKKPSPGKPDRAAPTPKLLSKSSTPFTNTGIPPEGSPSPPLANRLFSFYSLTGGALAKDGKRLTSDGAPIGALQNRIKSLHPEHLLIARPNGNREPTLEHTTSDRYSVRFPFGTRWFTSPNIVQGDLIILDQLTFAFPLRIEPGMGGPIAKFVMGSDEATAPILRLIYFNGRLHPLNPGRTDAPVSNP